MQLHRASPSQAPYAMRRVDPPHVQCDSDTTCRQADVT
jgi:hypothetical protein